MAPDPLQEMPLDASDYMLMQYAWCYILYLLGGVLFPDKANNTVHSDVPWHKLEHGGYAWMSHAAHVLDLLQASVLGSEPGEAPHLSACLQSVLCRWRGRRGNNDYSEARLLRYHERLDLLGIDDFMWMSYNAASIMSVVPQEFMGAPHGDFFTSAVPLIFFRFIELLPVDRVLRQFRGKQSPPRPPLNIDVFHKQSARNDDGWWPERLAEWFEAWNNRRSDGRRLVIDPATSLHPSRQYFDWYKERTRRFLCNPSRFYDPRVVDIPPQAPIGYGDSPAVAWPDVPQDCRQVATRVRRGRQAEQEEPGRDDLPRQPPQDDLPPRRSP
ncbi:hypothetical protein PIB30_065466 [Stylosanthes scabra]|uniref:Aminotransferase-like plant mobile domain-containing protein n=1 Tax=Stylosanthes scabra TaxID=79078 RepID=A0ABU6XK90_9FABA|nr:hypothetical protein [Stylosanthes scabra]